MNHQIRQLGAGLCAAGCLLVAQAQVGGPPPAGPVSPTVRAAEQTRMQGDAPDDVQAAPQLVLPLRRDRDALPASAPATGPAPIDDRAARCAAQREGCASPPR